MNYDGLQNAHDEQLPHLGGNIIEGDSATYSPSVWNYLIDRFAVKSVLDLGCGMGYSSNYFHSKGMYVVAVDGLPNNVRNSVYPSLLCDLTKGPVTTRVDLVHCQEVVEHIEEEYLENLLSSLACGKFIVMTNALPGQGGYHHVNCQPTEYWINHLKRYNCELLVEDSNRIRRLADQDGAVYMAQTGTVFANRNF